MDNKKEMIYSPGELAQLLKVKESTLRKYSLVLQKEGYNFYKNDKGHRAYFDKDVIVFRKFIDFSKSPDMTLERSANAVMAWVNSQDVSHSDTTDITEKERYNISYNELLQSFNSYKDQQEKFNQELLNKLQQQHEYIEKRLNERDSSLMTAIREIQEQKQLAAAQEPEKKKGFLARLFGG